MSFSQVTEPVPEAVGSDRIGLDDRVPDMPDVQAALDGVAFPADLDEVLAHLIRTRAPARVVAQVAVLPQVVYADAAHVYRSVDRRRAI
ncbi:MAG: DUF2795 domain-containing protein [Phycicoccus sp.]